jgi:hypothetical protein
MSNNIYDILKTLNGLEYPTTKKSLLSESKDVKMCNECGMSESKCECDHSSDKDVKKEKKSAIGEAVARVEASLTEKYNSIEESGLQAWLGDRKYTRPGMDALRKAGREGASKEKMAKIRAKYDKMDESETNEDMLSPKQQKIARMAGNPKKIDANDLKALRAGKKKNAEGNEFSGALDDARKAGKKEFNVGGKTYQVKEAGADDFLGGDNPVDQHGHLRLSPTGATKVQNHPKYDSNRSPNAQYSDHFDQRGYERMSHDQAVEVGKHPEYNPNLPANAQHHLLNKQGSTLAVKEGFEDLEKYMKEKEGKTTHGKKTKTKTGLKHERDYDREETGERGRPVKDKFAKKKDKVTKVDEAVRPKSRVAPSTHTTPRGTSVDLNLVPPSSSFTRRQWKRMSTADRQAAWDADAAASAPQAAPAGTKASELADKYRQFRYGTTDPKAISDIKAQAAASEKPGFLSRTADKAVDMTLKTATSPFKLAGAATLGTGLYNWSNTPDTSLPYEIAKATAEPIKGVWTGLGKPGENVIGSAERWAQRTFGDPNDPKTKEAKRQHEEAKKREREQQQQERTNNSGPESSVLPGERSAPLRPDPGAESWRDQYVPRYDGGNSRAPTRD